MTLVPFDDEEEEGLCLDNDSLIVKGDEGIPIKGFGGQRTTLTHDEQERMRQTIGGCKHKNTKLDLDVPVRITPGNQAIMTYACMDCGITIIQGHVLEFNYHKSVDPNVNNPFITGKH